MCIFVGLIFVGKLAHENYSPTQISAFMVFLPFLSSGNKEFMSVKVMKSEQYFTKFVAERNLSSSTADHFTKLCEVL